VGPDERIMTVDASPHGSPDVCSLPYTTTAVEVLVCDSAAQELFRAEFQATYNFIAP
jgi:hypothetical protein